MMRKGPIAIVFVAALLAGCEGEPEPPTPVDAPSATATAELDAADLFVTELVDDAQLLFVGQDSAEMAGRPGAAFVPFSTFSVERDGIPNELPSADTMAAALRAAGVREGRIVIVGDPIPAGRAYAALDYLGLGDRAALLDGGRAALASLPIDSGAPARSVPAELEIGVREDMIVDAAWVHARLDDPSVAILDARPPAEFSGEIPGGGVERPGHIPGARNVFWQTLVRSPNDSRLREEAELRRILEEAGAEPGDTIVAYCRTGGQASFLYSVARHLGYDVRLYDGSFVDWSRTEYPVER